MTVKRMALWLCVIALLCGCVYAQTTTGTLTGTITDSSDAAVPGAQVQIKNLSTGAVRDTTTGPEGIFRFNSLVPARYSVTITAQGFSKADMASVDVTPSAVNDVGRVALKVGTISTDVEVTAAVTPVQTTSSENSKLVDSDQIVNLSLKGRDMFAVLETVPGVYFGNAYLTGGDTASESTALQNMQINGGGTGHANFQVDGITDLDTGSNSTTHFEPNMDSIAEMRVLTTNYQAEYGRNSSGQISVVTKGGSQEFHGGGFANKRHEMFNAKSWSVNNGGQQKSLYRFFVWGYNVGGPVYIPHVFNTQKKRLFFYFSQEYTRQKPGTSYNYAHVPTAAYLAGDFSNYQNSNGQNFMLHNPTNPDYTSLTLQNLTTLAGTTYYDSNSAKYGQAMLKALPAPNLCNAATGLYNGALTSPTNCDPKVLAAQSAAGLPGGDTAGGLTGADAYGRNYYWTYSGGHPHRNDTVRADINLTSKLTAWARWINDFDLDNTAAGLPLQNSTGQFSPEEIQHPNPGHGWGVGITYTISPTMVNEFTFGKSYNSWSYYPADQSQISRSNILNAPSFDNFATDPNFVNDKGNPRPDLSTPGSWNYIVGLPAVAFGGGQLGTAGTSANAEATWSASNCGGTCPYTNWNDIYSFNDAVSKVMGKHNLKAGFYYERTGKVQYAGQGTYTGSYNFAGGNQNMLADTKDGFSNAWLGNFQQYSEGQRVIQNEWFSQIEAFIQDNWRVSRRVTLDLGVRFYHMPPEENLNYNSAEWVRSTYSPANAMRIYYPFCDVSTAAASCPTLSYHAYDPATGFKTFSNFVGNFVPTSVGGYTGTPNPFPGMQIATTNNPNIPLGLFTTPGVSPAFRVGMAWDVFGDGKTAIRAGFGQFLNRGDFNQISGYAGQQPVTVNRSIYYTNIGQIPQDTATTLSNLANISSLSPIGPGEIIGPQKYESSYNGSVMVQQNLGFGTVLETSWVFNLRRHIGSSSSTVSTGLNPMPMFAQYQTSGIAALNTTNPNPACTGSNCGSAQDPTKGYLTLNLPAGSEPGGMNINDNLYRTLPGLGGLTQLDFAGSADYHSLQVVLRRNMTKRLSYGLSYNWSKLMYLVNGRSDYFPDKFRNWGPSYQPTPQALTVNYVYQVPNLSEKLNFKPMKWVTDNWTVSGITQWRSDVMTGYPSLSFANVTGNLVQPNQTGTTNGTDNQGARMLVVGNPELPSGLVSFKNNLASLPSLANFNSGAAIGAQYMNGTPGNQIFNMASVAIANPCSLKPIPASAIASNPGLYGTDPRLYGVGENISCFGNAGTGSLFPIPGTRTDNWDMTFSKSFPLKSEKRYLIFRAEMYNIFNHTQFQGANINQSYDYANYRQGILVPQTASVGRYTGALNPRQMSFQLRFGF